MGARSITLKMATLIVLVLAIVQSREPTRSSPIVPAPGAGPAPSASVPPVPPFPGPGTVGHLADLPGFNVPATSLTPHPGDYVTSHDGEIVEAMDIGGSVIVQNRDVIVRRNRIGMGVETARGASAWIAWNTIGPVHGSEREYLVANGRGENVIYYRNEVFGGVDLFNFVGGGNVTIMENWAYGPYQMLADRYQMDQTPTTSHSDGIQVHHGGAHYRIVRNRFDLFLFRGFRWAGKANRSPQVAISPAPRARDRIGVTPNISPMTAGFLFQQTDGPLDDIVFDRNRIDADTYRLFAFPRNGFPQSARNVKIVNNTFVRRFPDFGRDELIGVDTPDNVTWGNNVDEHGTEIPGEPGMHVPANGSAPIVW